MNKTTKIVSLMAIIAVASLVAPVYPGGQFVEENGGGILIGESWDLDAALSNRSPGDGRTLEVYFAQGTAADRIAAIQASHTSWENILAIDFDDVGNTLPHAPSNGAGGGTPDGFNTHSFEFTLGCGGGLGVTPAVFNATTGQIVEADVFYEGNACVNWSTDGTPTAMQFELEAVAVHEMGHFIGLAHSGEVDSTMFPSIAPGTTASASLEPDDASSGTNVYSQDGGDALVPTGGISGRIIDGSNSNDGKVCALVYAFDTDEAPITLFSQAFVQVYSGAVVGDSAASNDSGATSGSYVINGLPDGDWFVLLDPIGNIVNANQITSWCALNSEAGFPQEWWNGVAESGAEGCNTCTVAITVSGGQITTGIDIFTNTGVCNTTEDPEVSCTDGLDNDCNGFGDCDDANCAADPACTGGCTVPADCNDGVGCTDDDCVAGSCVNTPNNANCPDDGLFCNGTEFCDAVADCSSTGDPCAGGETCNEGTNTCDPPVCDNDGTCEAGEDCNNCPNDCFTGAGAICGNNICEAADGEDCVGCPGDCDGTQTGNPNNRFCCGDGDGQGAIVCDAATPECNGGGFACTDVPASASCCGDDICEGTENDVNCAIDCGCSVPADCDDGNECTVDDCVANACQNTAVADGTACNAGADLCCGGSCTVIACDVNGDCDDGDACSTDTCNNGGTCSASCDNAFPACQNGDGCCPPGCTFTNDDDCPCGGQNAPCSVNGDCCSNNCRNNGKCSKP